MSAADTMKIKAIAPWFGGKRSLAPLIVRELGDHAQYFEPFCGSMAVLFAKEPTGSETVNDLHGDLTNLAQVIQHPATAEDLYDRLGRTLFCEALLHQAELELERTQDVLDVMIDPEMTDWDCRWKLQTERAYWYFLACWMARNGVAGTERLNYQAAVRWTKNGGSPTIRLRNAVESLPAWHRRLANVVILRRDAFDIIDRFEDVADTAIYVDPPYPAETRNNLGGNIGGGGRYLHEFEHGGGELFGAQDDHARLADALRAYKQARIVVSSYDCPRIRELYDGWTIMECSRPKNLHVQNKRGAAKKDAPEILLINGPSYMKAA